jgi:hypothetical protein
MTLPPSSNFRITALRLVCQVKPQNWAGKFAAAGDDKLSRIWYLGAYTVKVNLLADQFGSILIYRGKHTANAQSFTTPDKRSPVSHWQATGSAGLEMHTSRKLLRWPLSEILIS